MLGLLAGAAKTVGGSIVKSAAKDKAKDFITGKKKKVKPGAIKKKGGGEEGPDEKGGALAVRPQASMIPAPVSTGAITPISGAEMASTKGSGDNEEDILSVIRKKVIEIDKVLKGTLAQQKAASKKDKKSDEKQKRKKQEKILEKSTPKTKGSGAVKKLMAPAKGLFGGIFSFISNILLGRLLVVLLEKKPNLPGGNLLMFIAGMAEKIIDMIIGVLDAVGGFLAFGQEKLDSARQWLVDNKGDEAGERFDGLLGALTNLFNATVIVGSVFGALGLGPRLPGGKPPTPKPPTPTPRPGTPPLGKGKPPMKPTGPRGAARAMQIKHGHAARGIYENAIENGKTPKQAKAAVDRALKKGQIVSKPQTGSLGGTDKGSKIAKGGAKKIPKRLATKVLGKAGIKTIKGIAKGFSKIPIVGPIIVAVSSLLAGEPPAQALFKGLGAALGGFLGTFIPIPVVGTLIGEALGVFVGDLLYTLILGKGPKAAGEKLVKAFKTIMDVGGLALKFFMDGGKRFIENFPTVDVPDIRPASILGNVLSINPLFKAMMDFEVKLPKGPFGAIHKAVDIIPGMPDEWKTALKEGFSIRGMLDGLPGLQEILGTFAQFIPGMDKYIENGALKKVPNLLLTTPIGLPFLMPHVAKSFLPGLFGGEGDVKPNNQANTPPSNGSITSSEVEDEEGGGGLFGGLFGGGDQQELQGNDEGGTGIPDDGDGQTAAGTTSKGMQTGPAGYSRIGAGAAYHVDTKFHSSLGMGGMISAMDKMADAYAARDREIVFSGQGYARLKAYKSDLDPKEKKALLSSAIDAHSHSSFMRAEGFKPFDYYIPSTGIRDLYHPSTEKADILLPDFGGTTKVGSLYGGYGKSANIFDTSGKHVAMTGHGDLAYAEGGETLATPHMALIGEKGKEFVIDADSYKPIEKMLPGLFDAINEAKGQEAVDVLMSYADYEEPAKDELVMAGGSTGGSSYGDGGGSSMPDISVPSSSSKGGSDWKDILYRGV